MVPESSDRSALGVLPPDCAPQLLKLYDHWQSLRPAPDLLPGRQHFDPAAVPRLLPWIFLLDAMRDPWRFKYRIFGTEMVRAAGLDLTGHFLGEPHPDFQSLPHLRQYVTAAEEKVIAYHAGAPVVYKDRNFLHLERLVLPLARDGKTVDMLLGIMSFKLRWPSVGSRAV